MIEVFGIAFSIMGLLPSIASTLAYSIPAGPAGLVWGWFLASMFIFIVGLAMADLGYVVVRASKRRRGHLPEAQLCHANLRRLVLVDPLLRFTEDSKRFELSGWVQQHPWPSRGSMLHRLRLRPHVPLSHRHRQ